MSIHPFIPRFVLFVNVLELSEETVIELPIFRTRVVGVLDGDVVLDIVE